jgi:hypothetical protein
VVIISALRGKKYSLQDFAEAITITASCFVFGLETETSSRTDGFASHAAYVGLALVMGNILLDALTPHFQDVMFKETPELDTVQATFAMSCFSFAILFVVLLVSGSLLSCLKFMACHPDAILQVFVLSLGSTLTQYMISYTVKHFGPVVYAVISSLRQVLSVLISGFLFIHPISHLAWVTLLMMVGTVIIRAWRSMPQSVRFHRADSDTEVFFSSASASKISFKYCTAAYLHCGNPCLLRVIWPTARISGLPHLPLPDFQISCLYSCSDPCSWYHFVFLHADSAGLVHLASWHVEDSIAGHYKYDSICFAAYSALQHCVHSTDAHEDSQDHPGYACGIILDEKSVLYEVGLC